MPIDGVITYVTCCNNLTTLPLHAALGCPTNGHVNEGGVLSLVAESNCPAVTTEVGDVVEDSTNESRGERRGARDGWMDFFSFRFAPSEREWTERSAALVVLRFCVSLPFPTDPPKTESC